MRPLRSTLLLCGLLAAGTAAAGEASLPAFPGAEGFGAASKGGRGGKVIKVTTLKATGPGSLQEACSAKGPRIVVFDVCGVIKPEGSKNRGITITAPEIYIAGQTAPGGGITIDGMLRTKYGIKPSLHDVTVRFLRCRPTGATGSGGDCLQMTDVDRLIVDHVSVSWGCDENMDLCNSRDFTVQWCAIEESGDSGHPEGKHNFGMIMGYAGRNASLHHNLFAHHFKRAPLCGLEVLDHRNNVIYNMHLPFVFHPTRMNKARPDKPFRTNMIGNYFKAGPSRAMSGEKFPPIWKRSCTELYAEGNYCDWAKKVIVPPDGPKSEKPWPVPAVTTQKAEEACGLVLARSGCLPRDEVGLRTAKEVREGTGQWGRRIPEKGPGAGLAPGEAPRDSDGDGMPDEWEKARKLNPADPKDALKIVPAGASPGDRHKGYTYVEYYVNELADGKISAAAAAGK